jgi:hypothetical protein
LIITSSGDTNAKKLGKGVRVTYREVGPTCPRSCGCLESGVCYAMHGPTGKFHQHRAKPDPGDALQIYRWICFEIPYGHKVRHHVSGDCYRPTDD